MDAYGFLLTIISSGGALIVGIETFRDWLFRRREEYVELAKHKICIEHGVGRVDALVPSICIEH